MSEANPISVGSVRAAWNVVPAETYDAWRVARHTLLTASDVASVMGLSPHGSHNKIVATKRAPLQDNFVSSAMRGGQFLEAGVFAWYLDDLGRHNAALDMPPPEGDTCRSTLGTSLLVRHPNPAVRLGASPDGLVIDCGVPSLVEVKVTNPDAWARDWGLGATKIPRAWDKYSDVEPPSFGKCLLKHWVQLQTQLLCCGLQYGAVVGNCGTVRLDFAFEADAAFQAHIEAATVAFWAEVNNETVAQA